MIGGARPYLAPSGPQWSRHARVGSRYTDGRGCEWRVSRVEQGGRVVHWESVYGEPRNARTEATADHPQYPTDAQVLEEKRQAAREARRRV